MARGVVRALTSLGVLAFLAAAACAPKPTVEAQWPRADRERTVAPAPPPPRWPLTGLLAVSGIRRAVMLAVASGALPAGIEAADLVWELPGGTAGSRLDAVFQSQFPSVPFGPVGPASDADAALAGAYGAVLGYTGARPATLASGTADAGQKTRGRVYRGSGRKVTADVAALASAPATGDALAPAFTFAEAAPVEGATTVRSLSVPYSPAHTVEWRYDPASATYSRLVGGKAQSAGGQPMRAVNVVVMWARGPLATSAQGALVGNGRASVFRGQRKYSGTWERSGETTDQPAGAFALRAANGDPIPLAPGNTWIEIVPNALNVVVR